MTGSPMASVFEEILSDTVHFSTEPAGTSCSAVATEGVERKGIENGAERRRVKMKLLFIENPGITSRAQREEPGCCCSCNIATLTLRVRRLPLNIRWKPRQKSSTIMLSLYRNVNAKCAGRSRRDTSRSHIDAPLNAGNSTALPD